MEASNIEFAIGTLTGISNRRHIMRLLEMALFLLALPGVTISQFCVIVERLLRAVKTRNPSLISLNGGIPARPASQNFALTNMTRSFKTR